MCEDSILGGVLGPFGGYGSDIEGDFEWGDPNRLNIYFRPVSQGVLGLAEDSSIVEGSGAETNK